MKRGRRVKTSQKTQDSTYTQTSLKALSMPRYVSNDVENAGYKITIIDLFEGNLDQAHILYLTRIQRERFP
ncbi:hypothetical protein TUM3794_22010 [Shewanella colwelliana]|uniref:Uncharacterized protein n=1 Tax=Shewanella colwelliana TaxID=23 RepID=A0ABQ4P1F6_SHECO|nr:hypothetical protein TUM3794_22010 [Shewanella colwelliana]